MAARKKGPSKTVELSAGAAPAPAAKVAPKAVSKSGAKRSKAATAASLTAELPLEVTRSEAARAVLQAANEAVEATAARTLVPSTGYVFEAGVEGAREAYARALAASAELRARAASTASATTQGAMELNGKVLEAWRVQGEIAIDLWRGTLQSRSLSDAVRLQTSGLRQAYESAVAHWRDVAEATTRLVGVTVPSSAAGEPR
ncbi:MAG TPA: phasin family protein [Microvirga sp.]|jgi:hypothetical protein|nr:phasin family protein [Microvirga sp.]